MSKYEIVAPDHIIGMHQRAIRKIRAANRRWHRCIHFQSMGNGRSQGWITRRRNGYRGLMHERAISYWHERLQVIVPYFRPLPPPPGDGEGEK